MGVEAQAPDMSGRFIDVFVEADGEIREDCELRFQAIGPSRPVRRVRYRPDGGPGAVWAVEARGPDGSAETAWAAEVDDSGAGTSTLVYGGDGGLRLRALEDGRTIAEPYLLLSSEEIVE